MSTHRCPITACKAEVPDRLLMCAPHWRLVPGRLRSALYEAWDRGRGAGTERHEQAMRDCIREVESKLAGEAVR